MSQAKLTLRPPPNVDFVQGYPGIPPGAPDRPQAAVKGAIEVRVGPAGVKAKWVRIELRKIETLPGGGLANTFFDFVGQSPLNLWQSQGEYSPLSTQDFPFYIRIPESIPPSIALEKGAGVKYELIATLCIKGKKGFFRRDKHVVISTSAPIIVDKHELHSTWPVYAQPETRNISQDGVTLTVDRTHTCYGPGDRISVNATVKSDTAHTVILRGFEFALRETTVFRPGGTASGKRSAPQVKMNIVGEQKVPVNATLYGGAMHKAELAVTIPERHTTTTLNAARHIDITYVLTVRALLSTGQPIMMDLPVIISNWPKSVSVAAVRRIGLASNVSSHTPGAQQQQLAQHIISPSTIGASLNQPNVTPSPQRQPIGNGYPVAAPASSTTTESITTPEVTRNYNTAPTIGGLSRVDEFGRTYGASSDNEPQIQTIGGPARPFVEGETPRARARSNTANTANRLTVTNFVDNDMPDEVRQQIAARTHSRQGSFTGRAARTNGAWISAEEEKKRLYENAQAKVEAAHQGNIPRAMSPEVETSQLSRSGTSNTVPNGSITGSTRSAWPTAEEEKARLFHQAQDAVRRIQGSNEAGNVSPPPESTHSRNGSINAQPGMSAGAALYQQAMSSVSRNTSAASSAVVSPSPIKRPNANYLTADEEKAALKRYYDAKAAVGRTQASAYDPIPESSKSTPYSAPVAYDALYPPSSSPAPPANSPPPPRPGELPPAFSPGPNGQPQYLSEKEKLRRAYEAQDNAALAARAISTGPIPMNGPPTASAPPDYAPSPLPFTQQIPPMPNGVNNALSEKEILRRKFEQQDAAALGNRTPPATPARTFDERRTLPTPRAQPTPPGSATSPRPLTAVEEKARLRAMYAAEERGALTPSTPPMSPPIYSNGYNHLNGSNVSRQGSITSVATDHSRIPPPPPLAPRPPKEYIHETQEEDQRISAQIQAIDKDSDAVGNGGGVAPSTTVRLSQEPQSPYASYHGGSRPPLPPKFGLDDP
ncbi:hypothetical protein BC835DRAFT_1403695 [Cytidiella melzeri]|nr:hypothetical protein BC835DRAFT_1403695 [Cytidiella melzeri]